MRITALIILTTLSAAPSTIHAQAPDADVLSPGERVRLAPPPLYHPRWGVPGPPPVQGTISAVRGDTLVVSMDGDLGMATVLLPSVVGLEISRGVPSRAEGAARGAARWAFRMAMLAPLLSLGSDRVGEPPAVQEVLRDIGIMAAIGAVGGAITGAIAPEERWQRVPLPGRVRAERETRREASGSRSVPSGGSPSRTRTESEARLP